jgi:hypothetical protein
MYIANNMSREGGHLKYIKEGAGDMERLVGTGSTGGIRPTNQF